MPNVILRIDAGNTAFQRAFSRLKPDIRKQANAALGALLTVDVEFPPAKLHLHPLTGKLVPSALDPTNRVKVYTCHITSNDSHKASFTLENGTAYLRVCGPHDEVDDSP